MPGTPKRKTAPIGFAHRLDAEMRHWGVTQSDIAVRLGISQGTVSGWFNRDSVPQPRTLKALATMFGVTPQWFIDGSEPKLNDASRLHGEQVVASLPLSVPQIQSQPRQRIKENAVPYTAKPHAMIPLLSWAQAGMAYDFEEIPIEDQEMIPAIITDKRSFAIQLRGDSMEPKFSEGDVAVVMPTTPARHGDLVIAKIKEEGMVFKLMNLVGGDPNRIKLSSFNPMYDPNEYNRDQLHWIYPVESVNKRVRR